MSTNEEVMKNNTQADKEMGDIEAKFNKALADISTRGEVAVEELQAYSEELMAGLDERASHTGQELSHCEEQQAQKGAEVERKEGPDEIKEQNSDPATRETPVTALDTVQKKNFIMQMVDKVKAAFSKMFGGKKAPESQQINIGGDKPQYSSQEESVIGAEQTLEHTMEHESGRPKPVQEQEQETQGFVINKFGEIERVDKEQPKEPEVGKEPERDAPDVPEVKEERATEVQKAVAKEAPSQETPSKEPEEKGGATMEDVVERQPKSQEQERQQPQFTRPAPEQEGPEQEH